VAAAQHKRACMPHRQLEQFIAWLLLQWVCSNQHWARCLWCALCRYPPAGNRRYMAVFWDHGSGWLGYGADAKCATGDTYIDNSYCHIATLQQLLQGEAAAARSTGIHVSSHAAVGTHELHPPLHHNASLQPCGAIKARHTCFVALTLLLVLPVLHPWCVCVPDRPE
jgi:hypothetical protein